MLRQANCCILLPELFQVPGTRDLLLISTIGSNTPISLELVLPPLLHPFPVPDPPAAGMVLMLSWARSVTLQARRVGYWAYCTRTRRFSGRQKPGTATYNPLDLGSQPSASWWFETEPCWSTLFPVHPDRRNSWGNRSVKSDANTMPHAKFNLPMYFSGKRRQRYKNILSVFEY